MAPRRPWRRGLLGAAAVPGVALLLAAAVLVLEYRTQYVAARLGEYLLERNAQRPRAGAIWQTIEGSRRQRDRLVPVAPPIPELGSTPAAVLRASFQVHVDSAALFLQVRRLATPVQPGHATRELIRWLARNLAAYRAGQEVLGAALLPESSYRRQAVALLDSLLAAGGLPSALDRELHSRGAPAEWQLAALAPEDLALCLERLRHWLARAAAAGADALEPWATEASDSLAADADPRPGPDLLQEGGLGEPDPAPSAASAPSADTSAGLNPDQERAYQEAGAALLRHWADSLYTRDYLRLMGAWTDGEPLRATAPLQGPEFSGSAHFADSTSIPFAISRERASRALDPAASGRGTR